MSLRILIVTSNYWPEPTGIAIYSSDLVNTLRSAGYLVEVLTGLPHYPWWHVPNDYQELGEGQYFFDEVSIVRTRHFIPSKMNAWTRTRFETSLLWNLNRISKQRVENNFDLVLAYVPTLAAGIVGNRIARKLGIPVGLIVQDLSGAGAKQSGIPGGVLISKIARFVESKTLQEANSLVIVSPAMRDVVVHFGVPKSRVTQIPNYSAREIFSIDKNVARSKFGWPLDDFLVIHTGNMGAKQDLENVVRAADELRAYSKNKIYLVGHGNQESKLKVLCEGKKNISVLPAVPDLDYSALLSAADVLLVNERESQIEMSLPSKLTSYLYSERPVLAAVPRGGATWKFLDGVAELVEAGDPIALARKIEELSKQPEKRECLARRGKYFAQENLNPEAGRRKYLNWIEGLVKSL